MVKFFKSLLFIIASVIMGACIIFVPASSGPASVIYISVLGIYLGVDVADMIIKSTGMPKGDFKPLNIYMYVISFICLAALIVICEVMKSKADVTTAMTSFISSSLIVIGILLGGLGGNKIATNIDGDSNGNK